jgi:8-oxo-dGTP diphosphatase
MRTLIVAAGLIIENQAVLVTQRLEDSPQALLWEFPGGKVKEEEDPREALRRELEEELALQVEVGAIFEAVYHPYPDFPVLLLLYHCRMKKGPPRPLGCRDFRWVRVKHLKQFEMPAADESIRRKLEETPSLQFVGRDIRIG